ncbi:MAG: hypothetical protein L6Q26_00330 [Anaerolineales bacterium]|nr:hypothetical protein [Anaerolineales bacterium]NUQ84551.1 hypothetical protein [Anaerolineales bacterium]
MERRKYLPAILPGALASYFALGFLQNFYPSLWGGILFTVLLNVAFTLAFEIILERFAGALRSAPQEKLLSLGVLTLGITFMVLTLRLLAQYLKLFSFDFFLPDPQFVLPFLGLTAATQVGLIFLLPKLDATGWRTSPFILWIKRVLPGLLLASTISASAYAFATVLVEVEPPFADNYFDTDSPFWLNFMTAPPDQLMIMRAVHPMALLIFRPAAWLFSLFLNGDKFHGAILLNSLFGGVCVFLAWSFFKSRTRNTTYALLMASLLGISVSHFLLSVFLESYIFSAAALLAFVLLMGNGEKRLTRLVPVGLLTFGITITNFVQTCIAFLLVRRDIKGLVKYVLIVLALAAVLAFVQHALYPSSEPFYFVSNLTGESVYRYDLFEVPASAVVSRANVIFRNIALFSVVAPRPLVFLEELGCTFPCFNTIRYYRGAYQYASYIGFSSLLARIWFLLLLAAGGLFAWKLLKSPREASLQAALALNLLFNFILHMNYGDDPLLYSPNWTYALVLFFGISFEKPAEKKWLQFALLLFLAALVVNNLEFLHKVLEAVLPFK